MMKAGMDVARLNFSHGTYEYHGQLITNIRAAAAKAKKSILILQDLQGPRIRIGNVAPEGVMIKNGQMVTVVPQKSYDAKNPNQLPSDYPDLAGAVKAGLHVLIADGVMDIEVTKVVGEAIYGRVVAGGVVKSHKGINVPGGVFTARSLTTKDKKDIEFGISQNVDLVAMSFVRNGEDIRDVKQAIAKAVGKRKDVTFPGVVAKIELPSAVDNIDEIIVESDAIMVARGDLGIEAPISHLPLIQKELIMAARMAGRPVIVATQMLESMIVNRRPTRAEATDVANAVCDGTDAIMLSGESANGAYPVEAVETMAEIAEQAEQTICSLMCNEDAEMAQLSPAQAIACMVSSLTEQKKVGAVVVAEGDDELLRALSSFRPAAPVVVMGEVTVSSEAYRLAWGVVECPESKNIRALLVKMGVIAAGDCIVGVTGQSLHFID